MEEARKVAALLDFDIEFLGYPDGHVSLYHARLTADIVRLIGETNPDVIFCPFPSDHHRDHQASALALASGIQEATFEGEIWAYEIWSTIWPNFAVNIENVVELKRTAINLYESQVAGAPYADAALGLNRYRGLRAYVPYAEGLYICSTATFVQIAKNLTIV